MNEQKGPLMVSPIGRRLAPRAMFVMLTIALILFLLFGSAARSWAQDVISQEEPTPSSVDEITTPIERSFLEGIRRPDFSLAQGAIKGHPGVFSRHQARPQSAQLLFQPR